MRLIRRVQEGEKLLGKLVEEQKNLLDSPESYASTWHLNVLEMNDQYLALSEAIKKVQSQLFVQRGFLDVAENLDNLYYKGIEYRQGRFRESLQYEENLEGENNDK